MALGAVSGAEELVPGIRKARRRAGLVIRPILETETVELPEARLEERNDLRQIIGAPDPVGYVITPARLRPARIALLEPGRQRHDLRPAHGAAASAAADLVRKADLVKRHHMPLRPIATARWISAAICVRDWRKLSTFGVLML